MSKISQKCLDEALNTLGHLTEDDLKDYIRNVFNKARQLDDLFGQSAIQKAIDEVNNSEIQSLFEQAMVKTNNISKFDKAKSLLDKGIKLTEILLRRHRNLDYNIESAQRTARMQLHTRFFSELTPDEVKHVISGDHDLDIARAIDGKKTAPIFKSIAEKHFKYIDERNADLVTSNALPLDYINKDRHFRAIHNRSKMLSGGESLYNRSVNAIKRTANQETKSLWMNTIKSKLNLMETFGNTDAMGLEGQLDMKEVDNIIGRIYNNIINGRSEIFTRSTVANDEEAISNLSRQFFVWKDMESQMQYNKMYGYDTYFNALMSDIESSSSKIGMAKIFGANPISVFKQLKEEAFESGTLKPYKSLKADMYYKQVSGQNNTIASPTLAALGSNVRAYTSMSRLGGLALQSLSDVSNNIIFAKKFGYGFYDAYTTSMKGIFNAIPSEERAYLASIFKANVESHLGYIGKYLDAQSTGDITRKVSSAYYRTIGMEALDKGNKISAIQMMARHLANMSKHDFNEIPEATKKYFDKFNLTPHEWNVLRKKSKDNLFTVDNVDSLTNDEVKDIFSKSDKLIPLYDMKNHVYRKVYSMFDMASEDAILSPNAFTKAWCTLGTRPGTVEGEALRMLMQFKSYPLRYMDRYWASFMDADTAHAKLAFAVQMMAATIPLSLLSQLLGSLAAGKTPPDPSKMNYPELVKYSINTVAGGIGTFQKVLSPMNQNKNLLSSIINSPSLQLLSDSTSIPFELFTGNVNGLKKSLKNVSNDISPIETLPLISPMLRQMMGEKAYLQPGQDQLYGA